MISLRWKKRQSLQFDGALSLEKSIFGAGGHMAEASSSLAAANFLYGRPALLDRSHSSLGGLSPFLLFLWPLSENEIN